MRENDFIMTSLTEFTINIISIIIHHFLHHIPSLLRMQLFMLPPNQPSCFLLLPLHATTCDFPNTNETETRVRLMNAFYLFQNILSLR